MSMQYSVDGSGNTTSTKALVATAGGSWVDAPRGTPTSPVEKIAGETFRYQTTTLADTPNAGMYTATEITSVNKTTRAMNANGQALSDAQLAALDTNGDGQISTAEAAGTRLWADLNENGTLDSSELQGVVCVIKSADCGFYTRGNIARGLSMSDGAANAKHWRQVA